MQIIIPMSGHGKRFLNSGYKIPKPLIKVENRPIITHVIDLFPKETDLIFICNEDHLLDKSFNMQKIITDHMPSARVLSIKSHKKGPIHAIIQIREELDLDAPTVINYCDFTCYWNWIKFKEFIEKNDSDGIIPAYCGFHPHSLNNANYAFIKNNGLKVIDIQEKKPFTNKKMNEYASTGTYYFKTAKLMLNCFNYVIQNDLNVNSEFYVSMAYKKLLLDKKNVSLFPIQHFMQWGTPEDLNEYNYWSNQFRLIIKEKKINLEKKFINIMPMAGLGSRFEKEGYKLPKPLIEVSKSPMFYQALNDLPESLSDFFIIRKQMPHYELLKTEIKKRKENSELITIDKPTDGQARTVSLCVNHLKRSKKFDTEIITIGTCDSGVIFDHKKFNEITNNQDFDVIVWGIRNYPNAIKNPNMYGWINESNGIIKSISVKKPLETNMISPIVLGIFTFRNLSILDKTLTALFNQNDKVNDEYYVDSSINHAINLGYKCYCFEVDSFLCWGTPNDLKIFEYWQSCFDKWKTHPYKLENDPNIEKKKIEILRKKYEGL